MLGNDKLLAATIALRTLDRDNRKVIRQQTKAVAGPIWTEAVMGKVSTRLESRVLGSTARVTVSDQNVMLQSARIGRSLTGGAKPADIVAGAEFGSNQGTRRGYTATSRRGRRFTVTRRTQAQFRPRNRKGYVVYPAAAEVIPRIAALWVQTIVRGVHEAFEGR